MSYNPLLSNCSEGASGPQRVVSGVALSQTTQGEVRVLRSSAGVDRSASPGRLLRRRQERHRQRRLLLLEHVQDQAQQVAAERKERQHRHRALQPQQRQQSTVGVEDVWIMFVNIMLITFPWLFKELI